MFGVMSKLLFLLCLTLAILQVRGSLQDLCSSRGEQCGAECITEYQCSRVGCCWQEGENETTSHCLTGAVHRNGVNSSEWEVCDSVLGGQQDADIRVENCGWPGTSWEDCLEMGCCWNIIKQHQQPSCYKVISNVTRIQNGFHDEDLRIHQNHLEINYNGVWGLVCGANFREREAQVACRQMGFNDTEHAQIYRLNETQDSLASWINFVHCDGTEQRLASCSHQSWYQQCQDQFNISCEPNESRNAREGDVRLIGGPKTSWGRLEILHNGIWGSVCNHGFADKEAEVVCRQLHRRRGRVRKTTSYGRGRKIIWLDVVHCNGSETRLDTCQHKEWGIHDCTRKDVVSIDCGYVNDTSACSGQIADLTSNTGVIRSLNYPMPYPLRTTCQWRITVEPDKIIHLNMTAFCSYPSHHILNVHDGPSTSSNRVLRKYGGRYTGSNLNQLYSSSNTFYIQWVVNHVGYHSSCNPNHHGFELLYNATHQPSYPGLRLVNGIGYHSGRLEVDASRFSSDQTGWATICDEYFTDSDAQVVCRQLDFYGGKAYGGGRFGAGSGYILLDQLNCSGKESDIFECPKRQRVELCNHNQDVSVMCDLHPSGPEPEEGDLRLEGGPSSNTGRLEVYHQRRWGTVCDDRFGEEEARVACRQLGYSDGQVYNVSSDIHPYGSRRMKVWLDEVRCHGDEYVLHHCRHEGWENTDCDHDEDIAITCSGYEWEAANQESNETGELRLIGGNNRTTGIVQLYHHGEWGTVCQRKLTAHEVAAVACRELNLVGGMLVPTSWFSQHNMHLRRQWLDDLECEGHEGRLKDCFHHGWAIGEECVDPAEPLSIDCGRNASGTNEEMAGSRSARSVDNIVRRMGMGERTVVAVHDDRVTSRSTGSSDSLPPSVEPCMCRVHGDPIITTYDDQTLRLESPGTYMLSKLSNESDVCWFSVEICTRRSDSGAIYTDHVTIEYDASHVHLRQDNQVHIGRSVVVWTDDRYMVTEGLGFTVYADPTNTFTLFEASAHSNCSILVLFEGNGEESVVSVQTGGRYADSLQGLCGDCDGHMNDLRTAQGENVSGRSNKFELIAQSWRSGDCDAQP